ncbi:protein TIPIN homolog [Odontomachus brunneus]|uniref:protein TIPIN homolog n=1 Tax=Odontomachus brunneus TaxID=486640 RepID=UPI0013F2362B|nr:protein TIPIN homolog [Odontomachus brunneus]
MATTTFDYEGDEDIIAHYEDQESDGERGSLNEAEEATSDNDKNNEMGTKRKIDPSTSKSHIIRNPIPKLNTERLKGPSGIQTIEKYFEGFKFNGKGHEKTDLDRIMKRLEHWSHRLFPKYHFDDFLARVEQLGSKKDLQVYLKKYRLDMITSDDGLIVHDNMDNEEDQEESAPLDDFDLLITEQIQKQKQAKMQASTLASASASEDAFNELLIQSDNISHSQIPSTGTTGNELSDEIREKIERNKQLAIQRKFERQNEREEVKRKKLAENINAKLSNENSDLTVNDRMDTSQMDDV